MLLIRLDAIGDALALTPALAALRRHGIPFDVVLTAANAAAFAPDAAREAVVAEFALRSSTPANLTAIERLGEALRSRAYTHAIVVTEDPGGYRLARAVAAPARIGFADPWTKPLKALWTRRLLTMLLYRSSRLTRGAHECETLFRLVAPLVGNETPTRDPRELRPLVLAAEPPPDDRIAVQITDKWERWGVPLDAVIELVRRLEGAGPVRLLAARSEEVYARRIAAATDRAIDYFDDLESWKAAIAAAPAIVAPDSGAIHVGGTIGTPVVAVFAAQPLFDAQVARWSPWASPNRIVRADRGWPQRAADAVVQLRT